MGRSDARIAALLLGLLPALLPEAAPAKGLYLHQIPTRGVGAPAPAPARGDARVRLVVARPDELAASIEGARRAGEDAVEVGIAAYPTLVAGVAPRDRAPSFLIDFEEPPVRALRDALVARHGESPSLEALRRFTSEAIPVKSMQRSWDLASRVARSGEGDCTEHAVLLTALARSVGRPARVVTGIALVAHGRMPRAFGHAWSEIHDGGRFVPVDATPIAEEAELLALVPLALVEDEGHGYAIALARNTQRRWVREVEVLGPAPANGR